MLSWFDLVPSLQPCGVWPWGSSVHGLPNKNVGVGCLGGTTDNFRVKDLQAEEDQWKPKLRPLKKGNKAERGGGHRGFQAVKTPVTLEMHL